MKKQNKSGEVQKQEKLVEEIDFYYENNLMVLTACFLEKRGYCCNNNCRHCPYPKTQAAKLE